MTLLKSICSLLFFFSFYPLFAQDTSPYQYDKKNDIIVYSASATTLGLSYYLHEEKLEVLSEDFIQTLDRNSVNKFDRVATRFSSVSASNVSDAFLISSAIAPGFLFTSKKVRKDFGKKYTTKRTRPLVYNPEFELADKTNKSARRSFFSGHTSAVASNSFFTAKVFSDYFPDSKWKPLVWGVAATAPAITGYLRVRAGKHFPTDVIAGYALGAGIGILIPHLHKRVDNVFSENLSFSVGPTGGYFIYWF